jgi:hypothetical protein
VHHRSSPKVVRWFGILSLAGGFACAPLDSAQETQGDGTNARGAAGAGIEEQEAALSGENLAGTNLAGTNLAGTNLAGTNLAGTNLGGTNLAGTNLAGTNLAGTNLGGNNLAGTNLAGTNLAGTNLAGTNLAGTNLAGTNLAGTNLSGSNLAGTNLAGNGIAGTSLSGANLSKADIGHNIHGLKDARGLLYSGEELYGPRTGQCVVMGIGSTAFSKLLKQQSTNAKMHAAVGRLPWGFASTSGGSAKLSAWEAVVWGDKTYCSFVMAGPTNASAKGVAGFIKAIFRWNAPPSQSIEIGGMPASACHDSSYSSAIATYPGMMNAGAQFQAGKITAKNMMAGTLAFVTATTNNQSVMVDFSSWVMDSGKTGLVLGNVQSSPAPTYAESVYYVLDNGDGTVSTRVTAAAPSSFMVTAVGDSYEDLRTALRTYQTYWQPALKPIARRCGGALFLRSLAPSDSDFAAAVTGKCDAGLSWTPSDLRTGDGPWTLKSGTTAPMNRYMRLPASASATFLRGPDGPSMKPVLSETYVHLWEQSYDYPVSSSTCASAYSKSKCTSYSAGTRVSSNGHNYVCATSTCSECGADATCAPGKLGCPWGLVWNDNGACK